VTTFLEPGYLNHVVRAVGAQAGHPIAVVRIPEQGLVEVTSRLYERLARCARQMLVLKQSD